MLYVVATPIGNLGDITLRALEVLKSANVVAAEDTRHSGLLLKHFEIKKPFVSYHEHNEAARTTELVDRLARGENVALITDAGMSAARSRACWSAFARRSARSMSPSFKQATDTTLNPAIIALAGFVPCADVGMRQMLR